MPGLGDCGIGGLFILCQLGVGQGQVGSRFVIGCLCPCNVSVAEKAFHLIIVEAEVVFHLVHVGVGEEEKKHQEENLAVIRQFPLTETTPLTKDPLGSVSPFVYDPSTGKAYAAMNAPGDFAHITEIDLNTGKLAEAFSHLTKNDLVATVFEQKFGVLGSGFIAVSIALFAFSTVLGWSHYGTKACEYLLGEERTVPYRVLFVLLVFGGAVMGDNLAWDLADTFNGLMMIPNLIGVIALSGLVMQITRNYVDRRIRGKDVKPMLSAFPDIQQEQEAALADIDDQ